MDYFDISMTDIIQIAQLYLGLLIIIVLLPKPINSLLVLMFYTVRVDFAFE